MPKERSQTSRDIVLTSHVRHSEHPGGAYRLAEQFAFELAGLGHQVHFISGTLACERVGRQVEGGVQFWSYAIPDRQWPGPLKLFAHVSRARAVFERVIREHDVSLVFGHSPLQYYGVLKFVGREGRNWKTAYSVHSPFVRELSASMSDGEGSVTHGLFQRLRLAMVRRIERCIFRGSDVIQCDSAFTRGIIAEDYPAETGGKLTVVPGWVDLNTFKPAGERSQLRAGLGGPWNLPGPIFLSVRRLERRMGLDRLIEACAGLWRDGFRFQMLLGGDGTLRGKLEAMVERLDLSGCVRFLGRIPEQDLATVYAAADCFVLPTLALECFGLIVLEAHASGTPVIATPVGAIPEVMGSFGAAWLTDDSTTAAIAARMRDFLSGRLTADPNKLRANAELYERSVIARQLELAVLAP